MVFAPGRPSAQSNKPRRFARKPPERFVTGL